MNHTAGPWKVVQTGYMQPLEIRCDAQEHYWQHVADVMAHHGEENTQANARVVACAPEMLDVLENYVEPMLDAFDPMGNSEMYKALVKVREVIQRTK